VDRGIAERVRAELCRPERQSCTGLAPARAASGGRQARQRCGRIDADDMSVAQTNEDFAQKPVQIDLFDLVDELFFRTKAFTKTISANRTTNVRAARGVWGSFVSFPVAPGAEPRPQTHFNAFTALKMLYVAAILNIVGEGFFYQLAPSPSNMALLKKCLPAGSKVERRPPAHLDAF